LIVQRDQGVKPSTADARRERLRDALVGAAERRIAGDGLRSLRARDLAEDAGCAVGAIYNVVEDLDELILLANARTLAALDRDLTAVRHGRVDSPASAEAAIALLVRLALAYLDFAVAGERRWRALFDHRMPGRQVPDWYQQAQRQVFVHVEEPLRALQPAAAPERRALLARTLFAAVHGIVGLGLEEKLQALPLPALREQITFIVITLGRGMAAGDAAQ
jgi:AcrR family transcriptional regulator